MILECSGNASIDGSFLTYARHKWRGARERRQIDRQDGFARPWKYYWTKTPSSSSPKAESGSLDPDILIIVPLGYTVSTDSLSVSSDHSTIRQQ